MTVQLTTMSDNLVIKRTRVRCSIRKRLYVIVYKKTLLLVKQNKDKKLHNNQSISSIVQQNMRQTTKTQNYIGHRISLCTVNMSSLNEFSIPQYVISVLTRIVPKKFQVIYQKREIKISVKLLVQKDFLNWSQFLSGYQIRKCKQCRS